MELSSNNRIIRVFYLFTILLFLSGMLWGLIGAAQYLMPDFLKETLSFAKIRPLHVSSEVFWIVMTAVLSTFVFLREHTGQEIKGKRWFNGAFIILSITVCCILVSYIMGIFGGREYWEFNPWFALPILCCWIVFMVVFIRSVVRFRRQPVYIWMWLTGFIFFLFTYLESNLWLIPYFRSNIVNDMTVQWKSYGSLVGSWNMLIYGSSIYLMDKISGTRRYSFSAIGFGLYFLGLFNLMFNWGHHIYTLPTHAWVRHISYIVSMTELILLFRIINQWKKSLDTSLKNFHYLPYRFLMAADIWILLTLILAIAMSIPAINIYTHGTHITVAHTMGATIGINSFLLLAFSFEILKDSSIPLRISRRFNPIFWITQFALFTFWIGLIGAGVMRSLWQMSPPGEPFSTMTISLRPWFIVFFVAGCVLFTGLLSLLFPLLRHQLQCIIKSSGRK